MIWLMYYAMTYVLFFTTQETSHLSMLCAMSVFIMGGIGMVIPAPGGIGTFHYFVSATLVAYGMTSDQRYALVQFVFEPVRFACFCVFVFLCTFVSASRPYKLNTAVIVPHEKILPSHLWQCPDTFDDDTTDSDRQ